MSKIGACQKSTLLNVKNRLCQKSTLLNVKNRRKTDIRVRIIPTLENTPEIIPTLETTLLRIIATLENTPVQDFLAIFRMQLIFSMIYKNEDLRFEILSGCDCDAV